MPGLWSFLRLLLTPPYLPRTLVVCVMLYSHLLVNVRAVPVRDALTICQRMPSIVSASLALKCFRVCKSDQSRIIDIQKKYHWVNGFFFVHGMFSAFLSFTKWVNALFSIEAKYIAPNVTLYIALVYRSCSASNSEGYVSRWVCQVIDVPSRLG